MKNKINTIFRKIIPRKILTLIKFYHIYNNLYGHSNIREGLILTGKGEPIPWITYPAIEFLNTLDLKECDVFEFGSGSSTKYWANKAKSVIAIEKDISWFNKIKNSLPANSSIFYKEKDQEYVDSIRYYDQKFDVIIVDGAVRYPCAQAALEKLSDDGLILLDNSEWYPETCNLMRSKGFTQIDFVGFSPLNAFVSTTSLFYRSNKLLNKKLLLQPIASRKIDAYDDCDIKDINPKFLTS